MDRDLRIADDEQFPMDRERAKTLDVTGVSRTRGELLLRVARARNRAANDAFYDCGDALRRILRDKLYEVLGFRSFAEMVDASGVLHRTQAWKLVKVVETFPREVAARLGVEKAYALARLAERTGRGSAQSLVQDGVVIGGQRRDVNTLTVRTIQQSARRPPTPRERATRRAAEQLARRAAAVLAKAGMTNFAVSTVRRRDGVRIRLDSSPESMRWLIGLLPIDEAPPRAISRG